MKIIQFTDTHLVPPGETLYSLDPADQLRRAVTDVCEHHADTDLVVITGDLCNDGDPRAYQLLRDVLAPLPCEVRLLLGNHDTRTAFCEVFPDQPTDENGYVQSVLDTDHGRLLFMDSNEPHTLGGRYGADRIAWLKAALADAGDQPVTLFIHHPPVPDGLAHFRYISLHEAEDVRSVLRAHPAGVRHIVFGHTHVALSGTSPDGFAYSSGLAMSHRFITDVDDRGPWWTGGNPSYREIRIDAMGFRAYGIETGQKALSRAPVCDGP